jgi:hypothetical protein
MALALLTAATARADVKESCIEAHAHSQKLRRAGELRGAQTQLLACASEECPEVVRNECAQWYAEVTAQLPAVVVEARDAAGRPTADVRVYVDGTLLADRLSGTPLPVDPGEHLFRFEAADGTQREQRVVIVLGKKNHRLHVDFAPVSAVPTTAPSAGPAGPVPGGAESAPAEEGPSVPVAFYPLLGVAVVGLGLFAAFGITAANDADELESTCAPNCATEDAEDVHTRALVADISLVVGAASAVAAVVVLAVGLSEDPEPSASVTLSPVPGGAALGWRSVF